MKIIAGDMIVCLSQDQIDMYNGLTKLQRAVSLNKLEGCTDIEAYRRAGGKGKTENAQQASVSQILSNHNVSQFIDSFSGAIISDTIMTRKEMLERLTVMARTSITDLVAISNNVIIEGGGEDGEDIKQSYWHLKNEEDMTAGGGAAISELTASKEGLKIKIHDQKVAMKQIADIEGFNKVVVELQAAEELTAWSVIKAGVDKKDGA